MFIRRLDHFAEKPLEIFQPGGGDNNRIAPATNFFGDAQEASARIFLERQEE